MMMLNWTPEDAMREWCRVNPGCTAHPRGCGAYPPSLYALDFARAVEEAVLAKCTKFTDGSYAIFRDGCEAKVTEREARRLERSAFLKGVEWVNGGCASAVAMEACHEHYPRPTKRVPREVRLSDGRAYSGAGSLDSFRGPLTPDDMRKLLGLVEHPYLEVPDDG